MDRTTPSTLTAPLVDGLAALALGDSPPLLTALVLLLVGLLLAAAAGAGVERLSLTLAVGGARARFLGGLARWLVSALAVLTALERVGVETSSLLAVLASAGLAVGLALQGSLSHFASGVLLLVFRPFDLGDVVSVAGQTGTVIDIGVVSVTLETADKQRVVIPNSVVTGGVLVNLTRAPLRRVDVQVNLGYGVRLDEVDRLLLGAAQATPLLVAEEPVEVVLTQLGPNGPELMLRAWARAPDVARAAPALRRSVLAALEGAGIAFPAAPPAGR